LFCAVCGIPDEMGFWFEMESVHNFLWSYKSTESV